MGDNIKGMLESEDPDRQETGLMVLLHEGKPSDYVEKLMECTNSNNDNVRAAAFMVLGKVNQKSIVPVLEKGLEDKLRKIRMQSAIALAKYRNEKAITVLIEMIKGDIRDHSLHKRAIEALGKYKKKEFMNIFEEMLQHRRIVNRIKASEAIARIGNKKAYQVLARAEHKETDPYVKLKIRNAITNFGLYRKEN